MSALKKKARISLLIKLQDISLDEEKQNNYDKEVGKEKMAGNKSGHDTKDKKLVEKNLALKCNSSKQAKQRGGGITLEEKLEDGAHCFTMCRKRRQIRTAESCRCPKKRVVCGQDRLDEGAYGCAVEIDDRDDSPTNRVELRLDVKEKRNDCDSRIKACDICIKPISSVEHHCAKILVSMMKEHCN